YGGWEIALQDVSPDTIVYSFGVGEDVTFDREIIEHLGVQVFAFDPTPKSIQWVRDQSLPHRFEFFEYGIADYDGTATFYPPSNPEHVSHTVLPSRTTLDVPIQVPVRRLSTIMSELGHQSVGILKMDIEGAEYAVLEDIERSGIRPQQVLVELHHRFP